MSMDLLIKIPKEFEQHFKQDAFEDSLNRLCVDAHLLAGLYEQETAKMLIDAFKSAVPIPPHGRLIDADKADEYAYDELEVSYSYLSPREASRNMQLIYRNMPTVIREERPMRTYKVTLSYTQYVEAESAEQAEELVRTMMHDDLKNADDADVMEMNLDCEVREEDD